MKRISGSKPQRSMVCNWKTVWAAERVNALNPHCVSAYGQAHDSAGEGVEDSGRRPGDRAAGDASGGWWRASASRWRCRRRPLDGVEEALGFVDGRGEIGVSEHDDLAQGVEQAGADAVAFAASCEGFSMRWTSGRERAKSRTSSAVSSVEPSLTTMTSADQSGAAHAVPTTDSSVAMMRSALVVGRNDDAVLRILGHLMDLLVGSVLDDAAVSGRLWT